MRFSRKLKNAINKQNKESYWLKSIDIIEIENCKVNFDEDEYEVDCKIKDSIDYPASEEMRIFYIDINKVHDL